MGAGAAVLSSLLTAGIVTATDDSGGTVTTTSSSPAAGTGRAPVDSGNVTSPNWGEVAAAVEPSVVSVKVQAGQSSGEGSGVILDTSGRSLKAATLGDSSAVRVGDAVMALGNPLGLSDTVTTGIVSAVDRPVTTSAAESQTPLGSSGEAVVTNAIQTDAAVNPGNSGGALVDSRGRVIGITSSIASLGAVAGSSQSGSIGLGFAIPINAAKDVADQLVKGGTAQHAWMGVSLSEGTAAADGAQRQAAILQSVAADGPSAKAGLKTGDAVIAIDGEAVSGADSLVAQIRERKPGATVALTVVRDGSTQKVDVTLGTRPTSGQ
jgi:putative serine protease PepD